MKKIIFLIVIIVSIYGCKKDDDESEKFVTGTFSGQKTVHNFGTNYDFTDTIKIVFEHTKYTYFGSTSTQPGDFGYGKMIKIAQQYVIKSAEHRNIDSKNDFLFGRSKYNIPVFDRTMISL